MTSLLIKNVGQVVSPIPGALRGKALGELNIQSDQAIYIEGEQFHSIAPLSQMPSKVHSASKVIDAGGKVVIPGFVDSHSHLVFGGDRADEFAERCRGVSYEEIAAKGGGIASTVKAIRESSPDELKSQAHQYLKRALKQGITTMEVKSGYGLSSETELKILEIVRALNEEQAIDLIPTFLGAHAVPKEKTKKDYIQDVIAMMPQAAKLAKFCDVFCEKGYFSAEESKLILQAGADAGLLPKMHVNQFNEIGGIQTGIEVNAVSVDHLEIINDGDVEALAKTDIACTLLPGVSFFLNIPYAPGRKIVDAGCIPALATDFNPGSSMTLSMQLLISMACTQMQLSVEEALACATQNGGYALRQENVGCLAPKWQADLLILGTDNYRNLAYFFGENHVETVIKRGKIVSSQ